MQDMDFIPLIPSGNTWYVREDASHGGNNDGTSYADAWQGFSAITWGSGGVEAGDELYVCGTHRDATGEKLTVGASGTDGSPIIIRGDYSGDEGVIVGSRYIASTDSWTDEGDNTFSISWSPGPNDVVFEGTLASGAGALGATGGTERLLLEASSQVNCAATEGSYYYDSGASTLYVHFWGTTAKKDVYPRAQRAGVDCNGHSHLVVHALTLRGAHDGCVNLGWDVANDVEQIALTYLDMGFSDAACVEFRSSSGDGDLVNCSSHHSNGHNSYSFQYFRHTGTGPGVTKKYRTMWCHAWDGNWDGTDYLGFSSGADSHAFGAQTPEDCLWKGCEVGTHANATIGWQGEGGFLLWFSQEIIRQTGTDNQIIDCVVDGVADSDDNSPGSDLYFGYKFETATGLTVGNGLAGTVVHGSSAKNCAGPGFRPRANGPTTAGLVPPLYEDCDADDCGENWIISVNDANSPNAGITMDGCTSTNPKLGDRHIDMAHDADVDYEDTTIINFTPTGPGTYQWRDKAAGSSFNTDFSDHAELDGATVPNI